MGDDTNKDGVTGLSHTYTLCGGDVHVAADERQTIIHAHLEINHPETEEQTQRRQVSLCVFVTGQMKLVPTRVCLVWSFSSSGSSGLCDWNDVT